MMPNLNPEIQFLCTQLIPNTVTKGFLSYFKILVYAAFCSENMSSDLVNDHKEALTFLRIVPELRDQIYELVLTSSISPPKSPLTSGDRTKLKSLGYESLHDERTTFFPKRPVPRPGSALLRTCHQTRSEVKALAQRMNSRRPEKEEAVKYILDIMVVEERHLYPTWLNLSTRNLSTKAQLIDEVWVNMRIVGEFNPSKGRSGWRDANAWPPSLIWGLFNILARFFKYGPSFQSGSQSDEIGQAGQVLGGKEVLRMEELVLNVVTPTEAEMEGRTYADPQIRPRIPPGGIPRHRYLGVEGVMRPEIMAEKLKFYTGLLFSRSSHAGRYAESYGVYRKLGRIRLCLDEKEIQTWTVSDSTDVV
jgi:hypothetical protein